MNKKHVCTVLRTKKSREKNIFSTKSYPASWPSNVQRPPWRGGSPSPPPPRFVHLYFFSFLLISSRIHDVHFTFMSYSSSSSLFLRGSSILFEGIVFFVSYWAQFAFFSPVSLWKLSAGFSIWDGFWAYFGSGQRPMLCLRETNGLWACMVVSLQLTVSPPRNWAGRRRVDGAAAPAVHFHRPQPTGASRPDAPPHDATPALPSARRRVRRRAGPARQRVTRFTRPVLADLVRGI
jgi:hypothetical protein